MNPVLRRDGETGADRDHGDQNLSSLKKHFKKKTKPNEKCQKRNQYSREFDEKPPRFRAKRREMAYTPSNRPAINNQISCEPISPPHFVFWCCGPPGLLLFVSSRLPGRSGLQGRGFAQETPAEPMPRGFVLVSHRFQPCGDAKRCEIAGSDPILYYRIAPRDVAPFRGVSRGFAAVSRPFRGYIGAPENSRRFARFRGGFSSFSRLYWCSREFAAFRAVSRRFLVQVAAILAGLVYRIAPPGSRVVSRDFAAISNQNRGPGGGIPPHKKIESDPASAHPGEYEI